MYKIKNLPREVKLPSHTKVISIFFFYNFGDDSLCFVFLLLLFHVSAKNRYGFKDLLALGALITAG